MWRLLTLLLIFVAGMAPTASWAETPSLPWQKWTPALLDRAAREHKYILLHMAAVWCHWCHVMEGTTYRDPAIQAAILDRFIPVRVDQDADPELSYRYENWGWPATIMLDNACLPVRDTGQCGVHDIPSGRCLRARSTTYAFADAMRRAGKYAPQ